MTPKPHLEAAPSSHDTTPWPLLTADLAGTGGKIKMLEDFLVEELPAYLPVGDGEHCMALVEKRGLTTPQAIDRICEALKLSARDAGYAGLKDKQGITRQWISFIGARPEDLLQLDQPDLKVLEAGRHRNKIHTGHLHGNRFQITLREIHPEGLARARASLARLLDQGLPNYFGEQRFGQRGDNARRGLQLLRGEIPPPKQKFQRRLLISALQSFLFNEVLARRIDDGCHGRMLGGEVLQRTDSSGLFVSEDLAVDSARLERKELVITGPICGPRTPWPKEGSPAHRLEQEILTQHQIDPQLFSSLGRIARGGRRPLLVPLLNATVEASGENISLSFTLPPGSYATIVLQEITQGAPPAALP